MSGRDIRLDSWKAIAQHLDRTVRTVQRWERFEGLPVTRHVHLQGASVSAWQSEVDAWRRDREAASAAHPSVARCPHCGRSISS